MILSLAVAAGQPGAGDENLLHGPARCALSYLEALRRAGPYGPVLAARKRELDQQYRPVRALIAPRALDEIDHEESSGREHPLASWLAAARGVVLESFSLLEIRRAPRGAAVVTVRERWRRDAEAALRVTVSEYLVARVAGEWKVLDRRTGERFPERDVTERYASWFDPPTFSPR